MHIERQVTLNGGFMEIMVPDREDWDDMINRIRLRNERLTPDERIAAAQSYMMRKYEDAIAALVPAPGHAHWCASCEQVHGCHCRFFQCWNCGQYDCPVLHPGRCNGKRTISN